MTPGSFDQDTARAAVGDARSRVLEAEARADADKSPPLYAPPKPPLGRRTFWDDCVAEFERVVYHHQFEKRLDRNRRKSGHGHTAN